MPEIVIVIPNADEFDDPADCYSKCPFLCLHRDDDPPECAIDCMANTDDEWDHIRGPDCPGPGKYRLVRVEAPQ